MRQPVRTLLPAALALALAVGVVPAGAAGSGRSAAAGRTGTSARLARALPGGQMRGMVLNNVGGRPEAVAADLQRMVLDGINTVSIYIYLQTSSPTASDVGTYSGTASDAELTLVTRLAQGLGVNVVFQPVLVTPSGTGRVAFLPRNVPAFFRSYSPMIRRYAALAQRLGVVMFYVGSENDRILGYARYWRSLIASVRRVYSGALSYMPTAMRVTKVSWWDALDAVSLSPYFTFPDLKYPNVNVLRDTWRRIYLPYLARLYRTYRKPIIFAEIGYRSIVGAATRPYDYTVQAAPSMSQQADAYAALLEAVARAPYVKGVVWFYWQSLTAPVVDTGFSPQGKWAECVLAQQWSSAPTAVLLRALNCRPGLL